MNVLLVGSGGREHVLAWKIKQSPLVDELYCAPGNGGIASLAQCVDIDVLDVDALVSLEKEKNIGLTIVGPEAPLVAGLVDVFEVEGLKIFGPSRAAAQLEGSKIFSKEFMYDNGIPTAPFISFDELQAARDFLPQAEYPVVVKADGLAAGKGVLICKDQQEAEEAVTQIMEEKVFQAAGSKIVIEECLVGEEVSILALCDGEHYVLLQTAQDHKRIFDDDLGPNTGGMGAYCPADIVDARLMKEIESTVIRPTMMEMRRNNMPFKGVLYAGLMLTDEGPMVLEYNVRFGDPEIQAVLPRLKSDLVEVLIACAEGDLGDIQLEWDPRSCVCVVMSSGGYPGKYEKGKQISGLKAVGEMKDAFVFHAGTKLSDMGVLTNGGRVLGVTGLGDTVEGAIEKAYEAVEVISFDRAFFRRDIGAKALKDKSSC